MLSQKKLSLRNSCQLSRRRGVTPCPCVQGGSLIARGMTQSSWILAMPLAQVPWRPVASLVAALLALLSPPTSYAQTDDWFETVKEFHPYASATITGDTNFRRISDALAATFPERFGGSKSDLYYTLEAGFDTEFTLSRQRFLIGGRINRYDFARFDQFDYTGGDAYASWNWGIGNRWEGEIGYTFNRNLRDLSNQLIPLRDVMERHHAFASANRWLSTRWRLGAQANWKDLSFTTTDQLNKTVVGFGANLDYISKRGNSLGIEATYALTRFDIDIRNDRNFYDVSVGPSADWRLTKKTRLKANIGYKARIHDVLSERDFEGLVGRIKAIWKATGKTTLRATAWRDISQLGDEIANFAIIEGVSLEITWKITAKTSLRTLTSFERRNFQGAEIDDITPTLVHRVDKVTSGGLWLDWNARRNILFSLGFRAENRDSTRTLRRYDFQYLQAHFTIGL
jgi:Putative beta-barrel porin 2